MTTKVEIKQETPTKRRRLSSNSNRMVVSGRFETEAFKHFEEYRQEGFLCDFQIKVSGSVFRVHKNILAARSEYFKAFFVVNTKHQAIELNDVSKDAVEQCIHLMYTGEIVASIDATASILRVAKLFQLQEIFELYYNYLTAKLCPQNCLTIKKIAEKFEGIKIAEQAEKVIMENFDLVINQKEFVHLSRRDVLKYTTASKKTSTVWKAITVWGSHEFPSRKEMFTEILASLDLSRFGFEDLDNMMGNQLVTISSKSVAVVANEIFRRFANGKMAFNFRNWNFIKGLFRTYGLTELERKVNGFVIQNFSTISRTSEFYRVSKDDLLFFLMAIQIMPANEKMIWSALINWVKYDEHRVKFFSDMVKIIDLKKFTLNFIKKEVRNEPLVVADNDCLRLVIDALCSKEKKKEQWNTFNLFMMNIKFLERKLATLERK